MFKWSAFPFIRVTLCLAFGVLIFDFFPEIWSSQNAWLIAGAILLVVTWFFWKHTLVYGALTLLYIAYMGGSLASFNDESRQPDHYTNQSRIDGFVGSIVSDNTEKTNYQRYDLRLQMGRKDSSDFPLSGKLYLYIKKHEGNALLEYGDVVMVSGSYFPIAPPANPHEFDYQKYLKRQNVFAHAFVDPAEVRKIDFAPESRIRFFAYRIRGYAQDQLEKYISYERERAILTALLLGIKDHLDNDLKSAYAAAGAMHVLAVSGLHVGIIYLALLFLFRKIREQKWGMLPFVLVSVTVIWMYALVTGFSPSVMRAATMFTVIIISDGFKRKANIYNSLGVAACILIVYDPNMIYSVGFQLSFAAVFGIVKLFPQMYRLLDFRTKVADYLWSITCVSIAAQIATFPLTLLYFHQLPTYFLISNLIVIPAATVMLGVGILMLLFGSIVPVVGETIGYYFQECVWWVNELVGYVKVLPHPVFDWLYFDTTDTVLVYLFLIFLVVGLTKFSYPDLFLAALSIILLFSWMNFKEYHQYRNEKIVFYKIDDRVAIDLIAGKEAVLLVDQRSPELKELIAYQINPNRLANGLSPADETIQEISRSDLVHHHPAYDLIGWKGKRILLVHNTDDYEWKDQVEVDVVFLTKPQKAVLNTPGAAKYVLSPGFNYYDVKNFLDARQNKIDVHSLSQDGFWELVLTCKSDR